METSFIAGLLVGNCIGFIIACLCHIASEFRDDEEKVEIEEDNKE